MRSVKCISMGSSSTFQWGCALHPTKDNSSAVGETVVSRCFVGCLGQARKRCSNRWCCGPRNYASDVRPTDPLAAGVESQSQTLLKTNQPSDRGGSSLVRHVKCLTSLYMIFYVEKSFARKKSSLLTSNFTSRTTLFHILLNFTSFRVRVERP